MIYYHVDRACKLTEGQELSLLDFKPSNSFSHDYFANRVSRAGYQYLQDVSIDDAVESLHRFRELELEYVRRLHYPDKPSRFQSFFCTETLEDAKMWISRFSDTNAGTRIFAISSETAGSSHDAFFRDAICNGGNGQQVFSVYEEYKFAHEYWSGIQSNNPRREIVLSLLNNTVTVLERIS